MLILWPAGPRLRNQLDADHGPEMRPQSRCKKQASRFEPVPAAIFSLFQIVREIEFPGIACILAVSVVWRIRQDASR